MSTKNCISHLAWKMIWTSFVSVSFFTPACSPWGSAEEATMVDKKKKKQTSYLRRLNREPATRCRYSASLKHKSRLICPRFIGEVSGTLPSYLTSDNFFLPIARSYKFKGSGFGCTQKPTRNRSAKFEERDKGTGEATSRRQGGDGALRDGKGQSNVRRPGRNEGWSWKVGRWKAGAAKRNRPTSAQSRWARRCGKVSKNARSTAVCCLARWFSNFLKWCTLWAMLFWSSTPWL